VIVPDLSASGRNALLDDAEIRSREEAPAFAHVAPEVVLGVCLVCDGQINPPSER
jgi:hypothetical protein